MERRPARKFTPAARELICQTARSSPAALAAGIQVVTEELSIDVDPAALHDVGERVEVADQLNGQRNREYQSVFMLVHDAPLDDYQPDPRNQL